MSQRNSAENQGPVRPALEIDEEQLQILRSAPELLPPSLKCIAPLLESIRKERGGVTIPTPQEIPYL